MIKTYGRDGSISYTDNDIEIIVDNQHLILVGENILTLDIHDIRSITQDYNNCELVVITEDGGKVGAFMPSFVIDEVIEHVRLQWANARLNVKVPPSYASRIDVHV